MNKNIKKVFSDEETKIILYETKKQLKLIGKEKFNKISKFSQNNIYQNIVKKLAQYNYCATKLQVTNKMKSLKRAYMNKSENIHLYIK